MDPMPVRPTRQNSRKRAETASLVSLASTSAAKSSAILRIELALAMLALAESRTAARRCAALPRAVARMSSRILKPCVDSGGASSSKRSRRIMKKPLIGSVEVDAEQAARQRVRAAARLRGAALDRPAAEPPSTIAAGDREIGAPVAQRAPASRQQPLVVLQVGVHHRDVAGLARQHALDAGAGEAAPADAADAADAAVALADRARGRGGAVRRVVVDEDDFPVARRRACAEPLDQERNIGAFSLKVGTTMVSSGAGRTAALASARRGCADGLTGAMSLIADCGNAVRLSR